MISRKVIIALSTFFIVAIICVVSILSFSGKQSNIPVSVSTTSLPPTTITTSTQPKVTHVVSFDTKGGTPINDMVVAHGETITKPTDPVKNGYEVFAWKLDDKIWNFETDKVESDITLAVSWDLIIYSITYDFNGGETSEQYQTTYTVESNFDLVRPTKDLSVFTGWFDNDSNIIESIVEGMTGDLVLTAKWVDNLILTSLDETRGNISAVGSVDNPNQITVTNVPVDNKYHVFKGWYDEGDNLLSLDDSYTFILKDDEINYIYSKYMTDEEEDDWNADHAVSPVISGTTVYYGMYPQRVVDDQVVLNALSSMKETNFNKYYHYRGEYYTKRKARLARDIDDKLLDIRQFDNGQEIIEDQSYWFVVEPIKWRVLDDQTSQLLLLSDFLLDVQRFNDIDEKQTIYDRTIYSNNYRFSSIRKWLNESFYEKTFTLDQTAILDTIVDNSSETTKTKNPAFDEESTVDKVWLLSYQEYLLPKYGFENSITSSTRQAKTTDYDRAAGGRYGTEESNLFYGYYWTRSACDDSSGEGLSVASKNNKNGGLNESYIKESTSSIRPAITISVA